MKLRSLLGLAAPFVIVLLLHYLHAASFTLHFGSGSTVTAGQATIDALLPGTGQFQGRRLRLLRSGVGAAGGGSGGSSSSSGVPTAVAAKLEMAASSTAPHLLTPEAASEATQHPTAEDEREQRRQRRCAAASKKSAHAMSSLEATEKMLACAGLQPEPGVGLGEVLTAERINALLPPGAVVWLTFSNYAYLHFAQNWWSQVRSIGRAPQVVVAALDKQTLQAWRELRVHVLDFTEFGDASDFRGIGSDQARFRRMGAMKVKAFHSLLSMGRRVLVSDVDTVWTADPEPYLASIDAVDAGVTSDCLSRSADQNKDGKNRRFNPAGVWFCGHNPGNLFGVTFNTGVLFLLPTPATLRFTQEWHELLLKPTDDWHMEDQRGFNQLVTTSFYPTRAAPSHEADGDVVLAANGTMRLMPLPAAKFCGGHTFFVQQSSRRGECFNVHVTFTEGGVHGKLWRLKEAALWNLEPPGYFDEGRYLSFRPPVVPHPLPPAAIEPYDECVARHASGAKSAVYDGWWAPSSPAPCAKHVKQYRDTNGDDGVNIGEAIAMAPRLQAHLKMAARYLVALRDGMVAAWLLNRTFVFPEFECMCDRSEWPDVMPSCRLENSDLEFPFKCPLNFLINVHFMQGIENGNNGRRGVPYREHSFLSNPRLSRRLQESRTHVAFREQKAAFHGEDVAPSETAKMAILPRGATDHEVLAALGPGTAHDETAVLVLDDAEDVLGGFEDAEAGQYIRGLLDSKMLYGSWCCSRTNFHHPGATAFFTAPPRLPLGREAKMKREARGY